MGADTCPYCERPRASEQDHAEHANCERANCRDDLCWRRDGYAANCRLPSDDEWAERVARRTAERDDATAAIQAAADALARVLMPEWLPGGAGPWWESMAESIARLSRQRHVLCPSCAAKVHEEAPESVATVRPLTAQEAAEAVFPMASEETQTGYTRAQLADGADRAHEALHHGDVDRAHEALHAIGASGVIRVGCATPDPEAQRLVADLVRLGERELPCGHQLADLVAGDNTVTFCGACKVARDERRRAQEGK